MKKIAIIAIAVFSMVFVCSAQQKGSNASVLTGSQAKQVAKLLKRHNVMIDFCGCCEKSPQQCIKIDKVMNDSISVTVTGTDMASGEKYKKTIDVAEVWVPRLKERRIMQMQSVGQMAGIPCDPCTAPSVPTGKLGEKMLAMELDGLMEAEGGKAAEVQRKGDSKAKAEFVERKAEHIDGHQPNKTITRQKQVPIEKKRIDKVSILRKEASKQ